MNKQTLPRKMEQNVLFQGLLLTLKTDLHMERKSQYIVFIAAGRDALTSAAGLLSTSKRHSESHRE